MFAAAMELRDAGRAVLVIVAGPNGFTKIPARPRNDELVCELMGNITSIHGRRFDDIFVDHSCWETDPVLTARAVDFALAHMKPDGKVHGQPDRVE